MQMVAFWDIAPCSLVLVDRVFGDAHCFYHHDALIMEAVRTSETSVYFKEITRYKIPEGDLLYKNLLIRS
jgi:hypothetical protein